MGKSKLGTPFKLKNQGVGGAIGAFAAGAAPSIFNVLKLKYPDIFETPEEKLEKEKFDLLKKAQDLNDKKQALEAQKYAEEISRLKEKTDILNAAAIGQFMAEEAEKRKTAAYEETLGSNVAARMESTQRARKTMQEIAQGEQKFAKELTMSDIDIKRAEIARDLEQFELDYAKETREDRKAYLKAQIDSLNFQKEMFQTSEFNRMFIETSKMNHQQYMDMTELGLKAIDMENDVRYKQALLGLQQLEQTISATGGDRKFSDYMKTLFTYGIGRTDAYIKNMAEDNPKAAMANLDQAVEIFRQYNRECDRVGWTDMKIPVPTGMDKKTGKLQFEPMPEPKSSQGATPSLYRPYDSTPDYPRNPQPMQMPQFLSPSDYMMNVWGNRFNIEGYEPEEYEVKTDKYGNPLAGKKKR